LFLCFFGCLIALQRLRVDQALLFHRHDSTVVKITAIYDTNSVTQEIVLPPRAARCDRDSRVPVGSPARQDSQHSSEAAVRVRDAVRRVGRLLGLIAPSGSIPCAPVHGAAPTCALPRLDVSFRRRSYAPGHGGAPVAGDSSGHADARGLDGSAGNRLSVSPRSVSLVARADLV